MLDSLQLPYVQRGAFAIVLLAIAGGVLGTWIVLRGLAFFSHAVGTAAFPGLVLADGLGFSPHLGALGTAGTAAGALGVLSRRRRDRYDSLTGLVLVGALAAGVVLASDVFRSGAHVETLLFGSLLTLGDGDLALAGIVAAVAVLATVAAGPRWLATGFDEQAARSMGIRGSLGDAALLALVAATAIAMLAATGALLATALLVVPAATTRPVCTRVAAWQLAAVALAIAEGLVGLWASLELNVPPGATIAALTGVVFVLVAARRLARRALVALGLTSLALLAGCGGQAGGTGAAGPVGVVATTTQLGDIVSAVGGDAVDVDQLLQPNSDPHDYEPRPADVQATAKAAVVFASGGLDGWVDEVVERAGGSANVVVLGDQVPVHLAAGDAAGERYDPHWWHDPRNVAAAVARIRDVLIEAVPAKRAALEESAAAYLERIRALDEGIEACIGTIPAAQRKLVTDHDAFGYFAARYGIRVVGAVIPSQTTQSQPSAGALARLSGLIRRERVRAVFSESSVNPRLARAIAAQTGASAAYTLYGDTLGPRGSDGATYLTMERHNADAVVRGLSGGTQGCQIRGI